MMKTTYTKYLTDSRQQRLLRGWSLSRVADALRAICEQENQVVGITANMVWKWEQGKHTPSPLYQQAFCQLYQLTAEQLGFVDRSTTTSSSQIESSKNKQEDAEYSEMNNSLKAKTLSTSSLSDAVIPQGHGTIEQITQEQQFLISDQTTIRVLQDMNQFRRRILQELLNVACVSLVLPPEELLNADSWERLSNTITGALHADKNAINDLQMITKSYWRLRAHTASPHLLQGVLGHFQTIVQIMQTSQPETISLQLYALAAETAQIIGQMLFDMRDYATAWSYYKFAIYASQQANNQELEATALGRLSLLLTGNGKAQQALPFIQEAQRLTQRSTATYPWLSAVEAEAHALVSDSNACYRALQKAEDATMQEMQDPYATAFNLSRLAGYKGVCFLRLHQPEVALTVLNEAFKSLAPQAIRRQARLLTDMGAAYVQQQEINEACKLASQALHLTLELRSANILQRIRRLRNELDPWKDTQPVKMLDELLIVTSASLISGENT